MLKALSVTELSTYITQIFEAEELLHFIKVYGEVSNLSFVRGNLYFNLKDENSIMPCIMFGASNNMVKEGDQILASGGMRYYGKGGKVNFYVTSLVPYGSGILYQKFLELKNKLEIEGVFDASHKKELPKNISTIGVITSKTGAVLHDIETVSHRRNPGLNIIVYPASVQGTNAELTIIKGLQYFDKQNVDVIIIARGGGSIEDLQPFNTEILAREIIKVSKPVISAVGHETDFTICDFASSIRAATPSEAAELVSKNIFENFDKFRNNLDKLYYLICNYYDERYMKIENNFSKIDMLSFKIIQSKSNKFHGQVLKLNSLNLFDKIENELVVNSNKLSVLDPIGVLKRGYAKLYYNSNAIKSINELKVGNEFEVTLYDGNVLATVTKIKEKTK